MLGLLTISKQEKIRNFSRFVRERLLSPNNHNIIIRVQ